MQHRHGLFSWINTLLGNLKTPISGTYHAFKFRKYVVRHLAERQGLFNRRFDMKSILPRLFCASTRTGSRPEIWLRARREFC